MKTEYKCKTQFMTIAHVFCNVYAYVIIHFQRPGYNMVWLPILLVCVSVPKQFMESCYILLVGRDCVDHSANVTTQTEFPSHRIFKTRHIA